MLKPTEEQIKKFWEWCGFKYVRVEAIPWHKMPEDYLTNYWYANNHWIYPDGSKYRDCPSLDLDNLFKYAVPKLKAMRIKYKLYSDGDYVGVGLRYESGGDIYSKATRDTSPTLALFWAIYEVIDK